jgi:hypothetical protein
VGVGKGGDYDGRVDGAGSSKGRKNIFPSGSRNRLGSGGGLDFRLGDFRNESGEHDPGGYRMGNETREQASCIHTRLARRTKLKRNNVIDAYRI